MSSPRLSKRRRLLRWSSIAVILVGTYYCVRGVSSKVRGGIAGGASDASDLTEVSLAAPGKRRGGMMPPEDYADFLMSMANEPDDIGSNDSADDASLLIAADGDDELDAPPELGLSAPLLTESADLLSAPGTDDDLLPALDIGADTDTLADDQTRSSTGPQRLNPLFKDQPSSPSDVDSAAPTPLQRPRRLVPDADANRLSTNENFFDPRTPDQGLSPQNNGSSTRGAISGLSDNSEFIQSIDPLEDDSQIDEQQTWNLTLPEAIAIGLSSSPEIDVVEFDPGIAAATVSFERGVFDPVGGISVNGGQDDRLARSEIQTFAAAANFQDTDFFTTQDGLNNFFVQQRLQNGGSYEFGFGTDYRRFSPVGDALLIPSGWESSINFQFNQPLLRGRGRDITLQRLRVAKALSEQANFETQAVIRQIVRDIELAYWELSGAYARLKVAAKFVELGIEFERQENERQKLGVSARPQQLQTQSLLSNFKVDFQEARRDANIAEMRLRTEMGIASQFYSDASIGSAPTRYQLPIRVDIESSVMPVDLSLNAAMAKALSRPVFGIVQARQLAARHNVAAAENGVLPQLDATALYQKTGLDSGGLDDSVSTLFNQRFDTWAVGLTYQQSAYQRSAKADLRRSKLTLAKERSRMEALSNEVAGDLARFKADVEGSFETFSARRDQVNFLTQEVEALNELYLDDQISLFQRLESTRSLQAAQIEAVEAWTDLQQSTAQWRFTRGDVASEYGVPISTDSGHGGFAPYHVH